MAGSSWVYYEFFQIEFKTSPGQLVRSKNKSHQHFAFLKKKKTQARFVPIDDANGLRCVSRRDMATLENENKGQQCVNPFLVYFQQFSPPRLSPLPPPSHLFYPTTGPRPFYFL